MTPRLHHSEIIHHVAKLESSLTTMQAARLAEILDTVGDDCRFLLRDALVAGEFPGDDARAQDAFQDFRKRVNDAAVQRGVDLRLELDSRKAPPDQRYGWFTGGDLIDEGIASFTEEAANRGIDNPVTPEVAELGLSRRTRVYVSLTTNGSSARKVDVLLQQLRNRLSEDHSRSWEVLEPRSVGQSEEVESMRDRLCAEADVRVLLLSPDYLADPTEFQRALKVPGRLVAFALSELQDKSLDLGPLHRHDVRRLTEPWDKLRRSTQRKNYVNDLVDQIQQALADRMLTTWVAAAASRARPGDSTYHVPPAAAETTLRESQLGASSSAAGPPLRAVDRLVAWTTEQKPESPRLCALLGDVGMGKTTTAKLFTLRLLELRASGVVVPLPIFFDLRDVRVTGLAESMTLDNIMDAMLDATRPAGVPRERLCANVLRKRLEQGDAVVVFDGLDEVLVHLSPHNQQLFTRQLWRAVGDSASARMLLTCRTQYFRTIRDEVTYFTGGSRQSLRGNDYLALLMRPFRDEQVREYLAGNLDRDANWVDDFLATIAAVHDLTDLARRPLTLRLMADQVEFIETAKYEGRTLRPVDLYAEIVERWLSRDDSKHTLIPDHKHLLMEEIAAGLWRSGESSWRASQVEEWLLDLLERRPELQRHYREPAPDLWKADLRTATFLKREGDTFEFGHRSLFEYFLAKYLYRRLAEAGSVPDGELDAVAMPVPSLETLDFLGQFIRADGNGPRSTALIALERIGHKYMQQASELALAYALRAADRGHPHQSLIGIRLGGAQLTGWNIGYPSQDTLLPMAGSDFAGADLRRATFQQVDLTNVNLSGADLTAAELNRSRLSGARLDGACAIGTILRDCAIDGVDIGRAQTYRTQVLRCKPVPAPGPRLLIAPLPTKDSPPRTEGSQLRHFPGHASSMVKAVAWSPDGTRFLTGGLDGAWVLDATTREPIYRLLTDHIGSVEAVAWSPDGTHLLISGRDATRVLDATTGNALHQLTDHIGLVEAVAWSPDGTHLLISGRDGARVFDASTGNLVRQLTDEAVRAVAWSRDGARLLTGNRDGAWVWDATSGKRLQEVTSHAVRAVAWSPDGARLVTGGPDGGRVWEATTGESLLPLEGWVDAVTWSPNGTHLLISGRSGTWVWEAAPGKPVHHLTGHSIPVQALAWSPDGTHLLTGGADGVRVWETVTGHSLHHDAGHNSSVDAVAWSADGTRLLTGGQDGVRIWEVASGKLLHQLTDHIGSVDAVAWSPDGTRLLTGGQDGARVWDAATGYTLNRLTGHSGWVIAVAWSADGNRLFIAGQDGAWVWDVAGKPLRQLSGHTGRVDAVAWSPNGAGLITCGLTGAWVWDVGTGKPLYQLTGHTGRVDAVTWSPDGTRLVMGGPAGAWCWDAATGNSLYRLTDEVDAVAWSPDGTRLLTGGPDGAWVWDATTGKPLHQLVGHICWIRAVGWSPDSTSLLTGDIDGTVQIWQAADGQPASLTISILPEGEFAVSDPGSNQVTGVSEGAWRWLGWNVVKDDQLTRIPAESFGPLPLLQAAAKSAKST